MISDILVWLNEPVLVMTNFEYLVFQWIYRTLCIALLVELCLVWKEVRARSLGETDSHYRDMVESEARLL